LTHKQPTTVSSSSVLDLLDSCDALEIEHNESPKLVREHLLDPEARVEETQVIRLWNEITSNSDLPHIGLLIGQRINPLAKGLLASWVSQCETLGEAFSVFQKNIPLMSPSEQWQLKSMNGFTQLTLIFDESKGYPIAAIERSMSALFSWGKALTGENLQPENVTFDFPTPDYVDQYELMFGKNVQFNKSENSLLLDTSLLDLPIKSANPLLKKMIQEKAKEAFDELNQDSAFSSKVKSLIQINLSNQKSNIDSVSQELCMSRQTLYRKLKEEGTDFKKLSNGVRKTQAIELLVSDRANILQISLQLGFKESSSFYKAFHRWYGMTPSEYLIKGK